MISGKSNIFNGFHIKKNIRSSLFYSKSSPKNGTFAVFFGLFPLLLMARGKDSPCPRSFPLALPLSSRGLHERVMFFFFCFRRLPAILGNPPPNGGRVSFPATVRTADHGKSPHRPPRGSAPARVAGRCPLTVHPDNFYGGHLYPPDVVHRRPGADESGNTLLQGLSKPHRLPSRADDPSVATGSGRYSPVVAHRPPVAGQKRNARPGPPSQVERS